MLIAFDQFNRCYCCCNALDITYRELKFRNITKISKSGINVYMSSLRNLVAHLTRGSLTGFVSVANRNCSLYQPMCWTILPIHLRATLTPFFTFPSFVHLCSSTIPVQLSTVLAAHILGTHKDFSINCQQDHNHLSTRIGRWTLCYRLVGSRYLEIRGIDKVM